MNNTMNPQLAKQVVKEALNIAISRGCYGLVETTNIIMALNFMDSQPDVEFGLIEEVPQEQPAPKK
jgi:hypothetical protein